MKLIAKKRLEIVVESVRTGEIVDLLTREGASGYTCFESTRGMGKHGNRGPAVISGSGNHVIIAIVAEDIADRVLERLQSIWSEAIGVVSVGDVQVLRGERF